MHLSQCNLKILRDLLGAALTELHGHHDIQHPQASANNAGTAAAYLRVAINQVDAFYGVHGGFLFVLWCIIFCFCSENAAALVNNHGPRNFVMPGLRFPVQ